MNHQRGFLRYRWFCGPILASIILVSLYLLIDPFDRVCGFGGVVRQLFAASVLLTITRWIIGTKPHLGFVRELVNVLRRPGTP